MCGVKGFYVSASGAIQGRHGPLVFFVFLLQELKVNRDIPVFHGHGEEDPLVPLVWGEATGQLIKQMSQNHHYKKYVMGHSSCQEVSTYTCTCSCQNWPHVYKISSVLNSAEHEISKLDKFDLIDLME